MIDLTSAGSRPYPLEIPEAFWQALLAHVTSCLPEEACGLVAVEREEEYVESLAQPVRAAAVLPIENELHSPVRFRMDPAEQLKAFYWLEEHSLELGAIFHSHPKGPDHPSATDLAEFAYPGVLMLILSPLDLPVSPQGADLPFRVDWQIRAYQIESRLSSSLSASEVPLVRLADRNDDLPEVL